MTQHKNSPILLLLFMIMIHCEASKSKYLPASQQPPSDPRLFTPFPRKVWAYWDSGLDKARVWTHLCINNMRHFAEVSGWQFYFLTNQNYTDFLTPASAQKIRELFEIKSSYHFEVTSKSDVIRVFLLRDNGGIWIDANSFFMGDFAWLERLYEQPYVYNRFFPDPQVLSYAFSTDISGNKTAVWDQKMNRSVYLHPGMENWVMVAKPNSRFFQDVAANIEKSLRLGKGKMDEENRAAGVKFHNEGIQYFYMGNYQFQMALQRRQRQLDAEKGPIKYAVEYYRIWSIEATYSGLMIMNNLDGSQMKQVILQYSIQDLQDIYEFKILPMFVKMVGWVTSQMQNELDEFYNKRCNTGYSKVTKNSIFYKYLVNISSSFPATDRLKRAFAIYENQDFQECELLSKTSIKGRLLQDMVWLFIVIFLFGIPLFICVRVLYDQRQVKKISDTIKELDVKTLNSDLKDMTETKTV